MKTEEKINACLESLIKEGNERYTLDIAFIMAYLETAVDTGMFLKFLKITEDVLWESVKPLLKYDLILQPNLKDKRNVLMLKLTQAVVRKHVKRSNTEEKVITDTLQLISENLNDFQLLDHAIIAVAHTVKYDDLSAPSSILLYMYQELQKITENGNILSFGYKVYNYFHSVLGDYFLNILRLQNQLSDFVGGFGKPQIALEILEPFYEMSLSSDIDLFEGSHFEVMTRIASLLRVTSKSDEAMTLFQKILQNSDIREESNKNMLQAWHEYGVLLGHLERYDEALGVFEKLLKRRNQILEKTDDDISFTKSAMALIHWRRKSFNEAYRLQTSILSERTSNLGHEHPNTLKTKRNIGVVLASMGKCDQAVLYLEEAASKMDRILGENHPDTLKARANLASALDGLKQFEKALKIAKNVYRKQSVILGAKHIESLNVKESIAGTLVSLKRMDESLELLEELLIDYNEVAGIRSRESERVLQAIKVMKLYPSAIGELNETENTGIHFFAKSGELNEVKKLVKVVSDIDILDKDEKTALHHACQSNHFEIVKVLLENGASYNAISGDCKTPAQLAESNELKHLLQTVASIFQAIKSGDKNIYSQLLVSAKYVLFARDKAGYSLLHIAASLGDLETLKILLDKSLDVYGVTKTGNTALHIAALNGNTEVMRLLLNASSLNRVECINRKTKNGGNTALHAASAKGHLDAVYLLLQNGAFFNATNKDGKTALQITKDTDVRELLQWIEHFFEKAVAGRFHSFHLPDSGDLKKLLVFKFARNKENLTCLEVLTTLGCTEAVLACSDRLSLLNISD